jgi:hypothetical protein
MRKSADIIPEGELSAAEAAQMGGAPADKASTMPALPEGGESWARR